MNLKRLYCVTLTVLMTMSFFAKGEEFKSGDMKFLVKTDGTVELKEYKKAQGVLTLPSEVSNPKTGKEYTITSIGKQAFKGSKLVSITIPNTVTQLGEGCFQSNKSLETCNLPESITVIPRDCFKSSGPLKELNYSNIKDIENGAFLFSKIESLTLLGCVERINSGALSFCEKLTDLNIEYGPNPLIFSDGVFDFTLIKNLYLDRKVEYVGSRMANYSKHKTQRPFDHNTGLKKLTIGPDITSLNPDLFIGCTGVETLVIDNDHLQYSTISNLIDHFKYLNTIVYQGETFRRKDELYAYFKEIDNYNEFIENWKEFMRVAEEEPENIGSRYRRMNPSDFVKYKEIVIDGLNLLCDSVYFPKKNFSPAELELLGGFQNNYIMKIGADYTGWSNTTLEDWASADMLRSDLANNKHRNEYQKIIEIAEILLKDKNTKGDPYYINMQLVGLCGQGKWAEAAKYFPKVHKAVTDNGKYAVPRELIYMQEVINEHGQNAVAPKYPKAKKSSKAGDYSPLVDFFIQKGEEYYERRQAQKRFEKMYNKIEKDYKKAVKSGKLEKYNKR